MAESSVEVRKKKQEILAQIRKLDETANSLDRDVHGHLAPRKDESLVELQQLKEQLLRQQGLREREKYKLSEQLRKIRANIQLFQDILQSGHKRYEHNFVEKLKIQMELTEKEMLTFKTEQRNVFEDLVTADKTLTREINAWKSKFEARSTEAPPRPPTPQKALPTERPRASGSIDNGQLKEVAEYDRFVARTGERGGWQIYEHGVFMKLRKKMGPGERFVDAVVAALPGLLAADVDTHEQWLEEHDRLQAVKKDAIVRWRTQRTEHRDEVLHAAVQEARPDPVAAGRERVLEAQRREQQRAEVARWRAEREAAAAAEEEARREQQRVRDEQRAAEEAEKIAQREAVAAYKARKKEQDATRVAETATQAPRVRSEDLAARRAADEQWMARRAAAAQMAAAEAALKEERMERFRAKVEVTAKRDPSRLFKPTAAMRAHMRKDDDNEDGFAVAGTGAGTVLPPHLAVPQWRKGL